MIITKSPKGNTQVNFFNLPNRRSAPSYQFFFGSALGAIGARHLLQVIKSHEPKFNGIEGTQNYDTD